MAKAKICPTTIVGRTLDMVVPFAEAPVEWWYPHFFFARRKALLRIRFSRPPAGPMFSPTTGISIHIAIDSTP